MKNNYKVGVLFTSSYLRQTHLSNSFFKSSVCDLACKCDNLAAINASSLMAARESAFFSPRLPADAGGLSSEDPPVTGIC